MRLPTVFISYNPDSDIEQTLAVRLHTIGAVHGFNMLLPDRGPYSYAVSNETRSRIESSDFFILFSTTKLSSTVLSEIAIASTRFEDKSRILVVYDYGTGKNLISQSKYTEVYVHRAWPVEKILKSILDRVNEIQTKGKNENGWLSALGPILLTGIALFTLSSVLNGDTKPPKKKPVKKVARNRSKVQSSKSRV